MMRSLLLAPAAAGLVLATPVFAQEQTGVQAQPQQEQRRARDVPRRPPAPAGQPLPPSPLAAQAMAGQSQPDVLLDVPNLSVEQISLEVRNLDVNIALDARLANLLHLQAGATAHIDQVSLQIAGVRAQATLIVRLENVRAIIERTLQTLDNNPELVTQLLRTVDNTVNTVGGVANNTVSTVGGIAGTALRNGQLLDLARAGLTEVSRNVNATGQTVRQVRDRNGQLLEVITDTANRILSSRRLQQ